METALEKQDIRVSLKNSGPMFYKYVVKTMTSNFNERADYNILEPEHRKQQL